MNLIDDTKKRSADLVVRTMTTINQMVEAGDDITFASVAKRANVSRNFLYHNSQIRARIQAVRLPKMSITDLRRELIKLKAKK